MTLTRLELNLQIEKKFLDPSDNAIHNFGPLENPQFVCWGHRVSVANLEALIREHPLVKRCYLHLYSKTEINPKVFLIIELVDAENRKLETETDLEVFMGEAPLWLVKQIETIIEPRTTSFLILRKVAEGANDRSSSPTTCPWCGPHSCLKTTSLRARA